MSAHMSDPTNNILSLVGPVGNNALQAVGVAAEIKDQPQNPLVFCSLGDGTSQQGEVLEAIAEAVRWQLPVLFLIEDNRFSISTLTEKKTFYNLLDGIVDDFYGLPIHHLEGRNPLLCDQSFQKIVSEIRETRKPALALMKLERLTNHTNADDQSIYRDSQEIEQVRQEYDPIKNLRLELEKLGCNAQELASIEENIRSIVKQAAKSSQFSQELLILGMFHLKQET